MCINRERERGEKVVIDISYANVLCNVNVYVCIFCPTPKLRERERESRAGGNEGD